jgi:hypothetical protein
MKETLIMDEVTRDHIRQIFLSPRLHVSLITAAGLLGVTIREVRREIEDGAIVAVSTRVGLRIAREEIVASAMRMWEQAVIEEALGGDAERVLPEAIRLVELRARVPRYQRDMLGYLARRDGTSVDWVLARELEDVGCAHAEELATAVPGFAAAMAFY